MLQKKKTKSYNPNTKLKLKSFTHRVDCVFCGYRFELNGFFNGAALSSNRNRFRIHNCIWCFQFFFRLNWNLLCFFVEIQFWFFNWHVVLCFFLFHINQYRLCLSYKIQQMIIHYYMNVFLTEIFFAFCYCGSCMVVNINFSSRNMTTYE